MKKFQFQLATALQYRERQVDDLKALLGQAITELNQQKQTILRCQRQQGFALTEADQQTGNLLVRQTLPDTLMALRHVEQKIQTRLRQQEQTIHTLQQRLMVAMQDQKTLEIIKDRQWQAHKQQIEKADEQTLADMIQNRWKPQ